MNTAATLKKRGMRPAMTLIELTVVIAVLLALISLTFIGVRAWKRGADRAACIMNIRDVQVAVRGFANLNSLSPGDTTVSLSPPVVLTDEILGPDKFLVLPPQCPTNGVYSYGGDVIPPLGTLYLSCSLEASEDHVPPAPDSW